MTDRTARAPRVGRVQRQVLASLASRGDATVRHLADDWPGLTESGVRSALDGLWRRSLVERRGTVGQAAFEWYLTAVGQATTRDLFDGDPMEDSA